MSLWVHCLWSPLISSLSAFNSYVLIVIATILARICSGGLNFYLNRNWSFGSNGEARIQLGRYITLFIGQMCMSAFLVMLLSFLPIPLVIVKVLVDSTLFVISYFVQRNWVFIGNRRRNGNEERARSHGEIRIGR